MSAPRLVIAALVRNEAGRFWRSALEAWSTFADALVIVDDGSEDETLAIALDFPNVSGESRPYRGKPAWGRESNARAQLWDAALWDTKPGDYILILDADMVPACDPRPLLEASPEAVAFPLYDLWGEDGYGRLHYRHDFFWQAHLHPRIWLLRRPETPAEGWKWSDRGIHSGHLPLNFAPERVVVAPKEYALLHYAYATPALRREKVERYLSVRDQLSEAEWAHARSILDKEPQIFPLPLTPELRLEKAR